MTTATTEALARRRRSLGPTYRHFYEDPVRMVRAEGVWMYDADDRAYLDVYNNVPVVGHCHPRIVNALATQAARLNTHTRYLIGEPTLLAERLLATMPSEIGNVVFACSGTEANELAVRVAKAATGGTGFIVTQSAYHGTSETIAGMSPSYGHANGAGVYVVPAPVGTAAAGRFGAEVRACIERMRADGVKPAALLVDTVFSSDGLACDPPGFLADAVNAIREAGGLFIADEVQPGFGRLGEGMWGFARHGVVPDMVTMGKPMGNGHPVAAMAAQAKWMEAFARHTRYFNTFGGNSVSCAVALEVLNVIDDEGLIANARNVGAYLHEGLKRLAGEHASMGEVRGTGLYYAVDMRGCGPSDGTQVAARVVNGLRKQGVLIGASGPDKSVLKIRPPLPFSLSNVDLFVETMGSVLRQTEAVDTKTSAAAS